MTYSTAIATHRVQLVNERQRAVTFARMRVLWIVVIFGLVALVALSRIVFLGLSDNALRSASLEEALLPPRGEIADRNGVPLARAFPAYALWFNPKAMGEDNPLVKSPQRIAAELKAIFPDLETHRVIEKLAKGRSAYLRRRVLPEQASRVQAIGELALELPRETDRHYPQGTMAAHILGYIDPDGNGQVGMEQVLEPKLTDPAQRGEAQLLSIDMRVQGALESELRRGMLATNAMGAAGIVLDVDTGEVMALASLPEFDPNKVDASDNDRIFNRVTNQVYELGSTFKPITVAAAIDAGVVRDFGKRYQADRPLELGGHKIRDSHYLGATLNVAETLIKSSNIVTAKIADDLGENRMRETLEELGMNARPQIELPAKGKPIWPGDKWGRLTNMTVSYGHGIAVTPLHLANAYAAMVNGGVWRPATLYKLKAGEAPRGRRVFKASTSSRMRQLLRMISVYGTGKSADAPGFRVGGKTGSAEKPGVGGYRRKSLVSTFAAAFPMDRPRYVVIAMLDEPKGTTASSFQRTAAWNAAPIVGRLVPQIGPMLGIRPDTTRDVDISDLRPLISSDKT
ncbi:Peptidoglycan synthase [Alteripontixanthobacter maritimus]|uniref:Peptidoglycan synthase n=1 Tax=Alteripontixanthobacter maritimus TaxID=2161824 RepID=A0A369Q375_9SPHN|nr:penicillin-binding protein 2 [Alteripontixanthobacter maritimus]RDC59343.1 Peptidoglycan synthase [Alteripontixanthobacter maritimus]